VTKLIQDQDPTFAYCHVVAHKLSFEESKKNPENWKQVVNECPLSMCDYGCLHGAMMQHFRGTTLSDSQVKLAIADIKDVCEPRPGYNPSDIDKTMCYHGLGHVAMYMTGGKPERAIPVCQSVANRPGGPDYTDICIQGVFMSVFQSIDPEDAALVRDIKPSKEQVNAFCRSFGASEANCRRESFPYFVPEFVSADGVVRFCSYATTDTQKKDCLWDVMNTVTNNILEKGQGTAELLDYCGAFTQPLRGWCLSGAAMRLVQNDPGRNAAAANAICVSASAGAGQNECYDNLLYYAAFTYPGHSDAFVSYCTQLSEPWKELCLKKR
jgi:hypothetical protein